MATPYAGYTDATEVVANYLFTQLQNNIAQFSDNNVPPTVVQDVWYGDMNAGTRQGLIPRTPALAVVPGPQTSAYNGIGARPVLNTFSTFVMVYYGKLQDVQLNIHGSLIVANKVKKFVNTLGTFGGLIIDCMCSACDPGIAATGGALFDTTRMTFVSRSKTTLDV